MNLTRCKTCCMPSSRPDVPFIDGECAACISYKKREDIDLEERLLDLHNLLNRHDGRCIVPSSGGKDSTAQVLMLQSMGADVTVVTARTCHLTEIGRANIDNLAKYARTVEYVPNMTVRGKLNRLALEMVGDISWPEHCAIFTTPFKAALDLGIPLIFYGECPQNQYGGPPRTDEIRTMTRRWVSEFGGFLGLRPLDFIGVEGITKEDMADYLPPDETLINQHQVEAHFLGQYLPWDSHYNADLAYKNGMRQELPCDANWWPAENLDNAQTGIHDWFGWLKYGYGRGCAQISVDVRFGILTRADAMEWVEERDGLFPWIYAGVQLGDMLDRIDLDEAKLMQIAKQFKNLDIHHAG